MFKRIDFDLTDTLLDGKDNIKQSIQTLPCIPGSGLAMQISEQLDLMMRGH